MARQALFEGLIYDEYGNAVTTSQVGEEACYVIDDDGFHRHVDSEKVDRQILNVFVGQLQENKDFAIGQALQMMGRDDLMTKAALDAQVRNVNVDDIIAQGIPAQARDMMGMVGFRVVIDVQGEVVRMDQPTVADDEL